MSDFRAYLDALDRAGQLVRIDKPVSPQFEIAAYVRKSSDLSKLVRAVHQLAQRVKP